MTLVKVPVWVQAVSKRRLISCAVRSCVGSVFRGRFSVFISVESCVAGFPV